MKTKFTLIFILLLIISCEKPDTPEDPIDLLPPETHTGANKAGCLVNGKAFLPKGYFVYGNLQCFYQDGLNFGLTISQKENNIIKGVGISVQNQHLEVGETYTLKEQEQDSNYGDYSIFIYPDIHYTTTNEVTGEIKITYHDFGHRILAGTFWFDAINSNGEKVEIRSGRFDMQY